MIKKLITTSLILAFGFTAGRSYQKSRLTLDESISKVEYALKSDYSRDEVLKRLIRPEIVGYGNKILVDNLEEGLIRNSPNSQIYFQRILTTGVRSGYDIGKIGPEAKNSPEIVSQRDAEKRSVRDFLDYLVDSIDDIIQ